MSFYFLGCREVSYYYDMFKTIHMTNFKNELVFINIQIISFNSFKSYKNEILKKLIWKIMQELIIIKHVNFKINKILM
jgi:hypothetical protein